MIGSGTALLRRSRRRYFLPFRRRFSGRPYRQPPLNHLEKVVHLHLGLLILTDDREIFQLLLKAIQLLLQPADIIGLLIMFGVNQLFLLSLDLLDQPLNPATSLNLPLRFPKTANLLGFR